MKIPDRFICRREGHVPMLKNVKSSGIKVENYITSCVRCGKVYEVQNTETKHP